MTTICTLIGLTLLLIFIPLFIKNLLKIKRYKNVTIGKITDAENAGGEGIRGTFEYDVGGIHYTNKTSWSGNGSYHIGSDVKVYYDSNDPQKSYIKGLAIYTNMTVYAIFALAGIVMCIFGIALR